MEAIIKAVLVVVALIGGFAAKYFLGENIGETSQNMIDTVVEKTIGVDLDPLFKLDDKE